MAINDKNTAGSNDFWLNKAAESIYTAVERRTKSAEVLKTIILWAFALFSVGGFMLTLFGDLHQYNLYALWSFGFAFFILTLGYVLAGRAQYPVTSEYNPADVEKIKKSFSTTIKTQTVRFRWASGITSTGFFFLALGILIEFGTLKMDVKKPISEFKKINIKTGVERRGDSVFIPVTIEFNKNTAIELSMTKSAINEKSHKNLNKIIFDRIFYTDTSGRLYYSQYLRSCYSVKELIIRANATKKVINDTMYENSTIVDLHVSQ